MPKKIPESNENWEVFPNDEKGRKKLNKEIGKRTLSRPTKIVYPNQPCVYVSGKGKKCKRNAVGKSTLCKKHGGAPVVPENLLTPEQTQVATALNTTLKFKPEFHPIQFISLARDGMSVVEIAAEFGVAPQTIESWRESFAEMATAYDVGTALHESWWLRQGKDNLANTRFNTSLYKFLTGNKLGYSDKQETKNLNMNLHGVLAVPGTMSVDEWESKAGKK